MGSKQNNLDELCISVVATENSEQKEEDKHFPTLLATIRDFVVPVLLQTLIKGNLNNLVSNMMRLWLPLHILIRQVGPINFLMDSY